MEIRKATPADSMALANLASRMWNHNPEELEPEFAALTASDEAACFLAWNDNQPIGFNASEVLKAIKDTRQAIVFSQLTDCKVFEISGRIKPDTAFDNTMGYRFNGNTYSKIKIFN